MEYKTRKIIRLTDYDYSTTGSYFLTICLHNRIPYFGSLNHGIRELNQAGLLMQKIIEKSPSFCRPSQIIIEGYVVMHDHIHILVSLNQSGNGFSIQDYVTLLKKKALIYFGREITKGNLPVYTKPFWQIRFFDHVVRNDKEFENILLYIVQNPIHTYYDMKEQGIPVPDWLESHEEIEKYHNIVGD